MRKKRDAERLTPQILDEVSREVIESLTILDTAISIKLIKDQVEEVLQTLNPKEHRVLCLRFGLYDGVERTVEETAKELDTTPDDVEKTEKEALKKLRAPANQNSLKGCLD